MKKTHNHKNHGEAVENLTLYRPLLLCSDSTTLLHERNEVTVLTYRFHILPFLLQENC